MAVALAYLAGAVSGAILLADEKEVGTLEFLDALPCRRRDVWAGKVVAGGLLAVGQGVVLAVAGRRPRAASTSGSARGRTGWSVVLVGAPGVRLGGVRRGPGPVHSRGRVPGVRGVGRGRARPGRPVRHACSGPAGSPGRSDCPCSPYYGCWVGGRAGRVGRPVHGRGPAAVGGPPRRAGPAAGREPPRKPRLAGLAGPAAG